MLAGAFAPAFPIDLVENFALALSTASDVQAQVPVTDAVRGVFAAGKDEGLGDLNITGIVRRCRHAAEGVV